MIFGAPRCPTQWMREMAWQAGAPGAQPSRPRPARRRGRVRPAHRALPSRAAAALLSHRRLAPGRRGPPAGDDAGGVARARAVRGPLLAAGVAVHDRHQPLPQRAARSRAPSAGGARGPCRHDPSAGELCRDRLAPALSGLAAGGRGRCWASGGRSRGPLRGQGVGGAGLRVRAPAPGPAAARRTRVARRAGLPRRRGRATCSAPARPRSTARCNGRAPRSRNGCRPARSA